MMPPSPDSLPNSDNSAKGADARPEMYGSLRVSLRAQADACLAEGDLIGGCCYLRDLLAIEGECFGESDSRTLATRVDLANQLYASGDTHAAHEHYARALRCYRALGGENDPSVLVLEFMQAQHLLRGGALENAKTLLLRISSASSDVCGPSNAATLLFTDSLVATLFRLGELEPARSLILQLLNLRLGSSSDSDCVSTVATASAIVTRLLDLKCWSEAVEIQEAVVRLLRHVRGERDLDTLREVWLLAIIVLELGDIRQARLLLQCIVTPFSRLLGRTHSETLRAFSFLAALMAAQGDCTSARAILQRSYTVAIESGIDPAVICNLSGELSALDAFACHNPPDPGLSSSVRTLHLPSWKQ